jgi:hypothetical protein
LTHRTAVPAPLPTLQDYKTPMLPYPLNTTSGREKNEYIAS